MAITASSNPGDGVPGVDPGPVGATLTSSCARQDLASRPPPVPATVPHDGPARD
jgi:hypothetical protein